ncbi:MAG: leucine-rich repeat domain-containing protein [Eubacterium sp.]|nr:leucine-rich repeat domain-containing protein [Eubacterium sp.]
MILIVIILEKGGRNIGIIKKAMTVMTLKTIILVLPSLLEKTILPGTSQVEAATAVKCNLKNGTLTIYGKGEMPSDMIFKNNKIIKEVVIKKGITKISNHCFDGCINLKKGNLPKGLKTIGHYCFCNTGIKNITIPDSINGIGEGSFLKCKKVTKKSSDYCCFFYEN